MTSTSRIGAPADAGGSPLAELDTRPPGERYYRHPGDVVRLVLWVSATVVLAAFIWLATDSSEGVTSDLGGAAARIPLSARQLALSLAQVGAIVVPLTALVLVVLQRRWRRLGVVALAAAVGVALMALLDAAVDASGRVAGGVDDGTWVASSRFPSLLYLAGATAAITVGKAWLSRPWRRAADLAVAGLALVMALAGSAGVPALLLACAAGVTAGALVLVVVGAPNRRAAPAQVAAALQGAGLDVTQLTLERAEGGRAQLYRAEVGSGPELFVKVYGQDSRDADLLYRGYRTSVLRGPSDGWRSPSVGHSVEHEALLMLMAHRGGVRCPEVAALTSVPDGGSMALAMEQIPGGRLDQLSAEQLDDDVLDAVWREVATLHRARMAHRALRAGNILLDGRQPVLIDLGFGVESATPRQQAIDRAELLASLAPIVGSDRIVASAARSMPPDDLAAAVAYLQPLALSAATRKPVSKSLLHELRAGIAATTGVEPAPLEQLIRIRPRTLLTIAALTGAFYVLLPQLADVGDSVRALRTASWGWLVVSALMSMVTYVAAAVSMAGGVPEPLPFGPNIEAQMASSFVNRVTPANVGGMALNVRFMQKAGVAPAEAVTGVGLNSAVGAVVHIVLLFVFLAWAGKGGGSGFKIPASSKLLVIIAVVLALIGIFLVTRRGRRLFRTHVIRWFKQSVSSITTLARSPMKLAALFGGSAGVTLAYVGSLYAAAAAFHAHVSVAQVGAVYLGASIIAAAAPTPGGLGAMEAALVAAFTGVGVESGTAVAIVLSYRLLTYWLPILPGWISFHLLERKNMI